MAVCMCGQTEELQPVLIHDLSGETERLVRVPLCLACLRRTGIWCEKHEIARVCICDERHSVGEARQFVMQVKRACHRCAFDKLRLISPAEKRQWLTLLGEIGEAANLKRFIPPEDAGLLEPLTPEDVMMYGLFFCQELANLSLAGVVGELVDSLGQSATETRN